MDCIIDLLSQGWFRQEVVLVQPISESND